MIQIGFGKIPIYSICILISLFLNCILIFYFGRKQNINKKELYCSLIYEVIGIIIGAKILNMIQIKENKSIFYAGFSAYGGVIGGIFFLIIFSKKYKVDLKKLLYSYIPILPLMYSISKLGCFGAGCCYGIEYSGFGNIVYNVATKAPLGVKLFPVQLVESLINFIIFIYVLKKYNKLNSSSKLIGVIFFGCGLSKFVLEFFRASWNFKISSTQLISLFFIVIGIISLLKKNKNNI